jgi:hypothetical protein
LQLAGLVRRGAAMSDENQHFKSVAQPISFRVLRTGVRPS